jgi:hypothetical protein
MMKNCWPTHEQELLLKACLLSGEGALAAWQAWKSSDAPDDLDPGSFRLLPLLYRNLRAHDLPAQEMGWFKEVYQLTWSQNQLRFHRMAAILRALHEAGIRTMVLKGAALVLDYYRDHGLRPMVDFDLLVPTEQALAAVDLLAGQGWQPIRRALDSLTEASLSMWHGEGFQSEGGQALDLHWHMLVECCYPGADDDFWENARPLDLCGVPTWAPGPTDHLLHICVHGAKYRALPQFRWVADAMAILGRPEAEIDWARLVAQATERRLILPLRHTLRYLGDIFDAPIPPATLKALDREPVSPVERLEYRSATRPRGSLGRLPTLWTRYARYVRGAKRERLRPRFLGFPRYLQGYWELEHLGQLLAGVVSRGMDKIGETE